jgi:hypothetical protein
MRYQYGDVAFVTRAGRRACAHWWWPPTGTLCASIAQAGGSLRRQGPSPGPGAGVYADRYTRRRDDITCKLRAIPVARPGRRRRVRLLKACDAPPIGC